MRKTKPRTPRGSTSTARMVHFVTRLIMGLAVVLLWTWPAVAQLLTSNTCISCHARLDDEDMAVSVGQWRRSVHNPAGIVCQDCHGGNPATVVEDKAHDVEAGFIGEPEPEQIHEICGSCHQSQVNNYVPSPHGLEGEFWPNCMDCHGDHEIIHPTVARISVPDKCEECHEQKLLDAFITVVERGLNPLAGFRVAAEDIESGGVPTEHILLQTNMAKDAFRSRASHVFVMAHIMATVDSLEETYAKIGKDLETVRTEVDTRRKFGWLFATLFVLMAGVLWLYKRSLPEE